MNVDTLDRNRFTLTPFLFLSLRSPLISLSLFPFFFSDALIFCSLTIWYASACGHYRSTGRSLGSETLPPMICKKKKKKPTRDASVLVARDRKDRLLIVIALGRKTSPSGLQSDSKLWSWYHPGSQVKVLPLSHGIVQREFHIKKFRWALNSMHSVVTCMLFSKIKKNERRKGKEISYR